MCVCAPTALGKNGIERFLCCSRVWGSPPEVKEAEQEAARKVQQEAEERERKLKEEEERVAQEQQRARMEQCDKEVDEIKVGGCVCVFICDKESDVSKVWAGLRSILTVASYRVVWAALRSILTAASYRVDLEPK
eukprot:scaffold95213_cov22-Tisochrysis_lutea.AAC.1